MRTWERARIGGEVCGSCGVHVSGGDTLRAIYLAGGTIRKVRCPQCAGEPIDAAELDAPKPESASGPKPSWDLTMRHRSKLVPLSSIAKDLPFDPKQAQTGEKADWLGADEWTREPGEDDS